MDEITKITEPIITSSRIAKAQQNRTRNITIVAQTNSWMETKKLGELLNKVINEQVMPGKVFKVVNVTTTSTRPQQKSRNNRLADAISKLEEGQGEVESLSEEISGWRDGMQGTGLENTQKYSDLDEIAGTLETAKDNIQSEIDNLQSVSIPGMYG